MHRRLYALLIFLGTIAFLLLVYLYFFVYYTSTVVIHANIEDYTVEFYAPSTAQKRIESCQESLCEILDVSPFEYTIQVSKENYKSQTLSQKIKARTRQEFFFELKKQARLELLTGATSEIETAKQKIARLREESRYVASFELAENKKVTFMEKGERMNFEYRNAESVSQIADFPLEDEKNIFAEYIEGTQKVFFRIGINSYIFDIPAGKLHTLPYEIPVSYIKPGLSVSEYLVVSEKGTFAYDVTTKKSEFQYLFRDFIYWEDAIIGVIYADESQKKENFGLTQKGNLIVYYTPADKKKEVLLETDISVERIELQGNKVIFGTKQAQYELQNF